MADHLLLDILVPTGLSASDVEKDILQFIEREYPTSQVQAKIKSILPAPPIRKSPWNVQVLVDEMAKRLVIKYQRKGGVVRSFIAPDALLVPLSYWEPVPVPFILFQMEDGRHFWAYSAKKIADAEPADLALLMEDIAAQIKFTTKLKVDVACSGWLLSDGLAAMRAPFTNIENPPAYHNEPSVDFIVRRWDGQIQQHTAKDVMSYSRLRSGS